MNGFIYGEYIKDDERIVLEHDMYGYFFVKEDGTCSEEYPSVGEAEDALDAGEIEFK